MAKANLTAERLRELLHYEPETGIFTWLVRPNRRLHIGDRVGGSIDGGYLRTKLDGRLYRLHRLAWLYMTGNWPENDIDHIDGNTANNAFSNLRDVSRSVNLQNRRRAMGHNKTGVLGVSKKGTRWRARIKLPDGSQTCTYHATMEEAQAAYIESKRVHHAGNTL